ncbi:MAG TPA: asparagine synthase-related protein [Allosphingosinicella sp.]|jgi:asparagine synthase (glutamine-hydrolysing)
MTGIGGVWSFGGGADSARACGAMLAALRPYGPDDAATASAGDATFCRALARLLPEDDFDRQPLALSASRSLLVADLRLDNRDELADALGIAHAELAQLSDSALLARALERWGEAAVPRLVGDFAFAWLDAARGRLLLARDALGQRPLFWHSGRGFAAFASMAKGLHASGLVRRACDEDTLARYLIGLPPRGDASFHKDVRRVLPGHVVSITAEGARATRYWHPSSEILRLRTFDDYVEAYRFELDRAVACRLRRNSGPVATHLSGGWDSSAVTATAARQLSASGDRLLAYTAVPAPGAAAADPRDRFSDEGPLAAATADAYPNIAHRIVPGDGRSPLADLGRWAELFDRPVFNLSNHVWLADIRSRAKAERATVLLTGELGNWTISAAPNNALAELLAQRQWRAWGREAAAMIRQKRARLRGVAASSFAPWLPRAAWRRLRGLSSAPDPRRKTALHPRLLGPLLEEEEARELGPVGRPKSRFERIAALLGEVDFGEYRKGVLAGWSIDERDPTADRRLVEFSLSLPVETILRDGVRRPLARAALSDRLPSAVLEERRKGYQAADWSVGLTRDLDTIRALTERIGADECAAGLIDTDLLRRLVDDWPQSGWHELDTIGRYRIGLLDALTGGHFLLSRGEGGPHR